MGFLSFYCYSNATISAPYWSITDLSIVTERKQNLGFHRNLWCIHEFKKKKEKKEREVSQMWSEWTGGRGEGKREMVVSREILLSLKSLVGGAGGASTSRWLLKSSPFIIFCSYLGLGNRRTVNCLVPYSSRIYYYYY